MIDRFFLGVLSGAILGGMVGASIFFVPQEPMQTQVFLASLLKGGLTGLLLAGVLPRMTGWARTMLTGAVLGALMGLVVGLAKGFAAAPYVVQASLIEGLLVACVLKRWGH